MNNKSGKSGLKALLAKPGSGVVIAFVALCVFLTIATNSFLSTGNILVVLRQAVWVGIISIGMTFIISTGEIDLSCGSLIGISGMVAAACIKNYNLPAFVAILAALATGLVVGLINGFFVAHLKIASFIATLAMSQILRGLIYVYTSGVPIFGIDNAFFRNIAQGYLGIIPLPIIYLAVLTVIAWYLMYRTRFGRHVLSTGSNLEASRLVGINVEKIKMATYIMMGVLASISGILLTSRSEAAIVEAGSGYETDAIAAVVIAGTSMAGGSANLLGCILGAVLMTTIRNGLNLLKVDSSWTQVVIGIVILGALVFDKFSHSGSKE